MYLITLLLGKHPRGSLPVLSAHSFGSSYRVAHLQSAEEGLFSKKECAGQDGRSCDRCLQSGHATDSATEPGLKN